MDLGAAQDYAVARISHNCHQTTSTSSVTISTMMGGASGMLFLMTVLLISLMLLGLIVGTVCLSLAGNGSTYVTSQTTYWVYEAIAFVIAAVALLVLLYLGYAWSCACGKMPPACPPKKARNSCAPSSCY